MGYLPEFLITKFCMAYKEHFIFTGFKKEVARTDD